LPLSPLGFTWDHCVASSLYSHASSNGRKLDFAKAFGIKQQLLNATGLEIPLMLKHYGSGIIFTKGGWFNDDAAFVSPDITAGPDLIGECSTSNRKSIIILARTKLNNHQVIRYSIWFCNAR
jgi:hypothetical protein